MLGAKGDFLDVVDEEGFAPESLMGKIQATMRSASKNWLMSTSINVDNAEYTMLEVENAIDILRHRGYYVTEVKEENDMYHFGIDW